MPTKIEYADESWSPVTALPDDCDCIEGRNLKIIDGEIMHRVGQKAAGRLLDGRTWDECPTPVRGSKAKGDG